MTAPRDTNPLAEDLDRILDHTTSLWEALRGGRLLLTGGTGFFGCWLLESFLWANDRLGLEATAHVLTRHPGRLAERAPHLAHHPAVHTHQGDVRSFDFPDGQFDLVIHAGASTSPLLAQEQPLTMIDTIVTGTRRALDMATASGASRFLLVSSGAVYGSQPSEIAHLAEDFPGGPDPLSPGASYSESKRMAEHLCSSYAREYGLQTAIARGFTFVGPYQEIDSHFAIGNFISDRLAGRPVDVRGDGTPYRSYLYAADLAAWLWTLLFTAPSCRPYNVGSEDAITLAELAGRVASSATDELEVRIAGVPEWGLAPDRYVPSVQRARSELSLPPSLGLSEAIERTVRWHQARRSTSSGPG